MKKIAIKWVILGAGLALPAAAGLGQTSKAAGHWQGKIQIPEHELGVTVDIAQNPRGAWIGSMSITGSPIADVPLASVTVEGTVVRFTADLPGHSLFDGRLSTDGNALSGKASSAEGEATFALTRDGEANVKVPVPSTALPKEFEGAWKGAVNSDGKTMRVGLKLSPAADGSATATLTSIDQGNQEIPVTSVTIENKQMELEVRLVSGNYRGTLGAGGEISGVWSQGAIQVPLTFTRSTPEAKKP